MIRKPIIICLLSCYWLIAPAQQMNWARLMEDTVYYAKEYLPDRLMVTQGGPAQTWDFRTLKAPYAISRSIVKTGEREGKEYANLINGHQLNAILHLNGRSTYMVQVVDRNPVCPGGRLNFTLTPAYKPFFNGVLGEHYNYHGRMVSVFAWPRDMTCAWVPIQIPDSCRITYTVSEEIVVDGEGTLYLPTEVSSVHRQKIEIKKALRVEVKYGLTWRDVTTLVPGVRLLTTTEWLRFVSATTGLLLAEIELEDEMNPVSVEFKTHQLVTRVFTEEPVKPDLFAYPNPSYDVVRFQFNDLVPGAYTLKIFNILGVPVKEMKVDIKDTRQTITIDLGDLQRGTYLYRLQGSNGRTIKTKRVVLIQA